ncbi:hypothetical protein [Oxynema aestuarii]|uniref:Uncharacterized protein n=1 Tax=Oxynema aestuarii AP17 TaxID=2064643 RepID=A0A6H1U1N9_9CYAN|nr:hypothetical protein [Oxynema aestuarii]QIZ72741.1 hypothetical protein HCG48_20860 [Oxynema aestuarii AP17]
MSGKIARRAPSRGQTPAHGDREASAKQNRRQPAAQRPIESTPTQGRNPMDCLGSFLENLSTGGESLKGNRSRELNDP